VKIIQSYAFEFVVFVFVLTHKVSHKLSHLGYLRLGHLYWADVLCILDRRVRPEII